MKLKNSGRRIAQVAMIAAVASMGSVFAGNASASLPFDISATQIQFAADDLLTAVSPSGFSFTFFGTTYTNYKVSSNGYIGFPSSATLGNYPNTNWNSTYNSPVIASYWNDLSTGDRGTHTLFGGKIGTYGGFSSITAAGESYSDVYSITVPNAFYFNASNTSPQTSSISLQTSLFSGAHTVALPNGDIFNFQAGDIAMFYDNNTTGSYSGKPSIAIGVGKGSGSGVYVGAYGVTDGTIAGNLTSANRLTAIPTGESFFLYRWNAGTASYDASVSTFAAPVPEPATFAISFGALALLGRRRRA